VRSLNLWRSFVAFFKTFKTVYSNQKRCFRRAVASGALAFNEVNNFLQSSLCRGAKLFAFVRSRSSHFLEQQLVRSFLLFFLSISRTFSKLLNCLKLRSYWPAEQALKSATELVTSISLQL